jgi:hypothetical protein
MSALEPPFEGLAGLCLFGTIALSYQEIAEVNRKLPEDQQISYFTGHIAKYLRVKREYRRFYPQSRIDLVRTVLAWAGIVFVFLALWAAGSFKHWPH